MFESITQIDASSDSSFDDYVRAVKQLQVPILEILTKVFPLFRNVKAKRAAFLFCIHNQTITVSSLQPVLNALSDAFLHHPEIVDELSAEIKQVVRNTRPSSMPAMTRNRKDLLSSASAASSSFDMYTTVDDSLPTVVVPLLSPPPPLPAAPTVTTGRKKSPERTVSPLLFRYRTTESNPEPMIYLSYCELRERVQKHEHLEELWIGHYERHLFPVETEYAAAFGRSKEVFDTLPLFQQTAFKKKAGLF